jgi:GT2 family glycosyltransferase
VSNLQKASFNSSLAETELLRALAPLLEPRAALEIGSANRELTRRLLEDGYRPLRVLETAPDNAILLRTQPGDNDDVAVHELPNASGDHDPAVALAEAEALANVGVLRVDAGRSNYSLIEAAGQLDCELVIVRHWRELPRSLGKCPWTLDELTHMLEQRGLSNFMSIGHRQQLTTMEWNRATLDTGESATLVFIHDRVAERLMPVLLDALSRAHEELRDQTRLARADAPRSSRAIAALTADQAQLRRRIAAMAEALPPPVGPEAAEYEAASEATSAARTRSDDPVARLERRIRIRNAERERLLVDRRTSLRAWHRQARRRVTEWQEPRIAVLWQEAPRPLTVPRRYLGITAPRHAPSISIVTPSFQQGRFLDRTIGSVVSQRYPKLEYIIQDGGSTDETPAVLERHDHAVTHWESVHDGGQANGINRGFSRASGEIMAYLNSDDILLPGSLAFVARFFQKHRDVDVIYGHRILIDEQDRRIGLWVTPPHDDEMLKWGDCIPQETLFWRRGIWDAAGGTMDESFRFAIDWDLLLRFTERGAKIVRVNRYLGAFRVHPEQKTTALSVVCEEETRRLLRRCHGREVGLGEAHTHLRPYLRRHVRHHILHRAVERLPLPRVSVVQRAPDGEPPPKRPRIEVDEPMRLAVNLRQYLGSEMGGADVYVRNILRGMARGTGTVRSALTVFAV